MLINLSKKGKRQFCPKKECQRQQIWKSRGHLYNDGTRLGRGDFRFCLRVHKGIELNDHKRMKRNGIE